MMLPPRWCTVSIPFGNSSAVIKRSEDFPYRAEESSTRPSRADSYDSLQYVYRVKCMSHEGWICDVCFKTIFAVPLWGWHCLALTLPVHSSNLLPVKRHVSITIPVYSQENWWKLLARSARNLLQAVTGSRHRILSSIQFQSSNVRPSFDHSWYYICQSQRRDVMVGIIIVQPQTHQSRNSPCSRQHFNDHLESVRSRPCLWIYSKCLVCTSLDLWSKISLRSIGLVLLVVMPFYYFSTRVELTLPY